MQIDEFPEELLERIFSFTSQYTDYEAISAVCTKWQRIIDGLRLLNKTTFFDCLQNGQIYWKRFEQRFSPAQRHSHASCRVENSLYVFGGLSGTSTAYNDLWQFDLSAKTWTRPFCNGAFPSPKAAATLVTYETSILLYGGYSHPYSYLHQQVSFFDELHSFCTLTSQWTQRLFLNQEEAPPKLAGHTASIINRHKMILFGGCNGSLGNKTNSVYSLDVDKFEWDTFPSGGENRMLRELDGPKPECRYGHSQVSLDEERVFIIGGCGGPNKQYDDLWILHWPKDRTKHAFWQQVVVNQIINSPAQIYCISFVRYDNKLVTFGKPRVPVSSPAASASRPTISDPFVGECSDTTGYTITGNIKTPQERKCTCSSLAVSTITSTSHLLASADITNSGLEKGAITNPGLKSNDQSSDDQKMPLLNKSQRNTIKRLEALNKVASKFKRPTEKATQDSLQQQLSNTTSLTKTRNQCVVHSKVMQVFVLDIETLCHATETQTAIWQTPIVEFCRAPLDTILYTLDKGIDEILLFGGMEMEAPSMQKSYDNVKHRVSNRLYIMKPDSLFISSST